MAITLSTGVLISVASAYSASHTMSAVTNAVDAHATLGGGHGVSEGDYLEITSGWDRLDKRIVRAGTVAVNDVILLDVDTSSTTIYPVGTGVGTIRIITSWSQLSQVKSVSASGGSQNYADVTSVTDTVDKQIPTTRSAVTMTLDVFDDPTLAWYADVTAADAARTPYGLLMAFPNSSKLCANAYWGLMKVPTMANKEALMTQISLSYAAEPMRYST